MEMQWSAHGLEATTITGFGVVLEICTNLPTQFWRSDCRQARSDSCMRSATEPERALPWSRTKRGRVPVLPNASKFEFSAKGQWRDCRGRNSFSSVRDNTHRRRYGGSQIECRRPRQNNYARTFERKLHCRPGVWPHLSQPRAMWKFDLFDNVISARPCVHHMYYRIYRQFSPLLDLSSSYDLALTNFSEQLENTFLASQLHDYSDFEWLKRLHMR